VKEIAMKSFHWFKARVQEMERGECMELLESHRFGRIAFADDLGPTALPVNYALDGNDILVATSPYGAIASWAPTKRVAFEVDDIDRSRESGWSVLVRGRAEEALYLDIPANPDDRPYPWAEGSRHFILRIRSDSITGRRLIPS
jgi:hypothetical protein